MKNNQNTILWIIGIVIFLLVVANLPLIPWFAIVTKTTCMDNIISYWDLDGNVLDAQGLNNGNAYNVSFVSGKLGQAIEFNGTGYVNFPAITSTTIVMWIKNYSRGDTNYYFIANLNGTNYVNGALDNTKQIIPLGSNFGLNFNGSVDEIATFTSLSVSDMLTIYDGGSARKVCYTVSAEENVSCKDFAAEQVTESSSGCLNYSGDFFPNCTYEWETTSGFYIFGSECNKRFYCEDILSSDFSSQTLCQEKLNETVITPTTTTPTTTTTTDKTTIESIKDKLSEKVFEIAGYEITLLHFFIALIVIVAILYFMGVFEKK